MLLGTGVTKPTQWLDKAGVNSGSAKMRRGFKTGDPGVRGHHLSVVRTSGP